MDYFDSNIDNDEIFDDFEFEEDDIHDEDDFEVDEVEKPRYMVKSIACIKGTNNLTEIEFGNIRNRIFVNSTFEAISPIYTDDDLPDDSFEQCVFINCTWVLSDLFSIPIKNTKFIDCKFYDTLLDFGFMKNVIFENCTFVNSIYGYNLYPSNAIMENCTFIEIYNIIDTEK